MLTHEIVVNPPTPIKLTKTVRGRFRRDISSSIDQGDHIIAAGVDYGQVTYVEKDIDKVTEWRDNLALNYLVYHPHYDAEFWYNISDLEVIQ